MADSNEISDFIHRWKDTTGTEKANYQLFLTELCRLLELPQPDPGSHENENNTYVFERRVDFKNGDGSEARGFIDLYRRDAFVCEAKQSGKELQSSSWDKAMLRARGQAENYARSLPTNEGRPPFLIVTDVGRSIELYAEFSRTGGTYTPFPNPASHRLPVEALASEETRELLRTVWLDPMSLDPTRRSARVTRDIADKLAKLARSLEQTEHSPETVAGFLMRCLFTMFSEDVGLLPERSFTEMLTEIKDSPELFVPMLEDLWRTMNTGGFHSGLKAKVLQFNGGLFSDSKALELTKEQIKLLIEAARADWRFVEPAIFGTLLERALDPRERHKLGAHYTPRSYVERLVMPTVINPLREDWQAAQATAYKLEEVGKHKDAIAAIRDYLHNLCHIRVLDPACGTGNFLYVTLEHMKRLEGEVLNTLAELDSQKVMVSEGFTVDPHQFLGIEINPRAAKIAEMVLWIGYLQWHFRTHGHVNPPEPVLRDFHNIENRDAVLAYDAREPLLDESGQPVTHWDGRTTKPHPVTGKEVPDESARVPVFKYTKPRKAVWPKADFIVGNPPFIGKLNIREALGDGYVQSLRNAWKEVPDSADLVMYWWHQAATKVGNGEAQRFGLITTNSLRQTFNRRVVQSHLDSSSPISITFAIPDHPWVDSSDGAAVRISMSVGIRGETTGTLASLRETDTQKDSIAVDFLEGRINSNLTLGPDLQKAVPLVGNLGISNTGVIPHGKGMQLTQSQAKLLGLGSIEGIEKHIRPYRNGRDIMSKSRDMLVIDMFGFQTSDAVKESFPTIYQWLLNEVKPERDANRDKDLRDKWWLHRRNNLELRNSLNGLTRYIATVMTAKHRVFQFLDGKILPDQMLVTVATENDSILGILSSRIHVVWALATGGRLGVGNDSRYNKTRCFETFPFPQAFDSNSDIGAIADKIDRHRKKQLLNHPALTLTNIYNVLEKLREEIPLSSKEVEVHEKGLVSILYELHNELDWKVFEAYGWSDIAEKLVGKPGATTPLPDKPKEQAEAEEDLLSRLVKLNEERAAEEANGLVRWLRPEYQNPQGASGEQSKSLDLPKAAESTKDKEAWPKGMQDQFKAVSAALGRQNAPASAEQIAREFKRAKTNKVEELLSTLVALGTASITENGRYQSGGV